MKICFFSPRSFTGGPMAIHQAASRVNKLDGQASIMYVRGGRKSVSEKDGQVRTNLSFFSHRSVDMRLKQYNVPMSKIVPKSCHFIVPESMPYLASQLLELGCSNVYIWWLSVDNFPLSQLNLLSSQLLMRACTHLCQSVYARDFVANQGGQKLEMLSDFTDIGDLGDPLTADARKFDIAYLPSKASGAEAALDQLKKNFKVVALKSMSRDQIKETLKQSKIFLDFGHHPGKDRVPREAALCGAIPVVRHQGAAAVYEDVPLPDELLVDTDCFFNLDDLQAKITGILNDEPKWQEELAGYRDWIKDEERRFNGEIKNLVALTKEGY